MVLGQVVLVDRTVHPVVGVVQQGTKRNLVWGLTVRKLEDMVV